MAPESTAVTHGSVAPTPTATTCASKTRACAPTQVGADGKDASRSKRSAALNHCTFKLSFGCVMQPRPSCGPWPKESSSTRASDARSCLSNGALVLFRLAAAGACVQTTAADCSAAAVNCAESGVCDDAPCKAAGACVFTPNNMVVPANSVKYNIRSSRWPGTGSHTRRH